MTTGGRLIETLNLSQMNHTSSSKQSPIRMERDGNVAVIVINNPPVNAGSLDVRSGLLSAIASVAEDPAIGAAVLIGSGTTFVAGSDIREFGKPLEEPQLPAVIRAIQMCVKPVIAAIHGAALGGGFELALGCDARIASADAVVGLPEVTLGMIPGAGGTQHLPRLTGISRAIEIICSGRRIPAVEAQSIGLIDAVVTSELRAAAIQTARVWQQSGNKRHLGLLPVPQGDTEEIARVADQAIRVGRRRPQVLAAVDAVKSAARLPYEEALAAERAAFQQLRNGTEAAALRHLFFAEREARKVEGIGHAAPIVIEQVGVIGAGTMGAGIALCLADAGYGVTLVDQDEQAVNRGMARLTEIYKARCDSGKLDPAEAEKRLARICATTSFERLADVQMAIEAVFESMEVKTDVFRRLDTVLKPGAILASNTSYLDLDLLAAATNRPEEVVGLHFFSPAHVMRLLEVVRGKTTSATTLATALEVARRIGKLPVIATVGEGFIGNRIYAAYRRHCEFMLEEGAYPEEIDAALEAFGFAMGPFAVGDMSGLDIAWRMRQRLAASRDPRERYVGIADRLCEKGWFGQKTGQGWYQYRPGERKGSPDPKVAALIDAYSAAKGIVRRIFTSDEIVSRALLAMVNEAALVLEEGIASRASDIDLVMVNAYGFPRHEGGPLFWARRRNSEQIQKELYRLQVIAGHGFRIGDLARALT